MKSAPKFVNDKVRRAYEELENEPFEKKELQKNLKKAFRDIAENADYGVQIPKRQIPKFYLRRYGIDNIWKYNLPNAWRLMYSVRRDDIIVVAIILEWMNHREYERRFSY